MNLTLHLTERCNMDCSYCVNDKCDRDMSEKVLYAACDLSFSKGKTAGICFFGGEPLLKKELIFKALDYCRRKSAETGIPFKTKMTTNGTLLDEEFIDRAAKAKMEIGLSFDGKAQDICRRYADGSGTFGTLEKNAGLLLKKMPMSYAMVTVSPEAVHKFAESVIYLHSLGFKRVTATPAYGKRVLWTDEGAELLKAELLKLSEFYSELFIRGERFFFSLFDGKIRECITGFNPSERCHLGLRQMPVSTDGKLYACTQFIGDEDYCLGDVFGGIDTKKQLEISKRTATPEECKECELNKRCTNSCGCMNRLETGSEFKVSAFQCEYERMLIGITDELADKLFSLYPDKFKKRFMPENNKKD